MTDGSIKTIGRYEIEREIGRGGMAVVYKAFDPRLERAVAIKLIQSGAFGSNIFGHIRERFEREAKALAKLRHPNIVRVHDYGEHEGSPYLVMDYLEGATLKEVKKPLKVETAVRLIRPIADALDYVHRQGLLHRDVKPSNIMITPGQEVILTDFGIVKWIEDQDDFNTLTATGITTGTAEAALTIEAGLGETQTVLAGLRAASTETAAAAFRIETESGLNATLAQAAALQTEIAVQRAAVAGTEQANAEAVQRRETVSAAKEIARQQRQQALAATATAEARNPYVNLKTGDRITFGSYEQDNNRSNGPEPIGWRVLEVSGGSALIVSEYALDARAYNEDYESVMWATCTLRKWLNGEFYDTAFNEEEKGLIALTKVKNADNPKYGTDGGKDTEDRVFLLSLGEAERYFEDDEDRRAFPTEYAIAQDVYVDRDLGTVWWWLRSPGPNSCYAAGVDPDGSLGDCGHYVDRNWHAARPALRLIIEN